jgi:hypothetical protein
MALNETIARVTRNSISFSIVQDGGAGTTMTLANSDFVGNLSGYGLGGPLLNLLQTNFAPNSQAIQRAVLLGDASGLAAAARDLSNFPHCNLILTNMTVAGWRVDADVDAVSLGRGELNITGPAGAGRTLVTLEFRHSYNR